MEVILVQRAKRHDKEAFSTLMRENMQSMYKVAKAILKNDDDVADAMQETALTCWEKISTLRKNEYFKTWMIRILINHCNNICRQNAKYISDVFAPEEGETENEYANIEWQELLTNLDEKYRIVVVLYYVEGFKVKEIAKLLRISESAVKERLSTARKKMEKIYGFGKE